MGNRDDEGVAAAAAAAAGRGHASEYLCHPYIIPSKKREDNGGQ